MNDELTQDAIALAAQIKDDPDAAVGVIAEMDAGELRLIVGRLALMVHWAADQEDREAFWQQMGHLARERP